MPRKPRPPGTSRRNHGGKEGGHRRAITAKARRLVSAARDWERPFTTKSAMPALNEKIAGISSSDLAVDLLPMFESRVFVESWLESFHANLERYAAGCIDRCACTLMIPPVAS